MIISSGVNLQKLGIAATLFAQSFTFGGVIEEVPPFGSQIIVEAPRHPERPPESLLHSTFLADEVFRSAAGVDIFSQGQSLEQPQSFVFQPIIEEVVEDEPQIQSIIVEAEPVVQPDSVLHGTFLADNVELDIIRRLIVEAESPQLIPQSFFRPSEDIEDVRLDIKRSVIVDAPRHTEKPPESFLHSTFLADNVELDIQRQLIVSAEPIPDAVSITRGFAVPEIVVVDEPQIQSIITEAQPLAPVTSLIHPSITPPLVTTARQVSITIEQPLAQALQATVIPGLLLENIELNIIRRVIVEAEPIPDAISITRTSVIIADVFVAVVTITGDTSLSEIDVRAGGKQTIITLTGDTWQAAGTPFNQVRQIILDGITSAQTEATGWNNEVRDKQSIATVIRTSDTVVTITWSAAPDYDVLANEVITVTVPAAALAGSTSEAVATPTIGITADIDTIKVHDISFSSVSRSMSFSCESRSMDFSSASRSMVFSDKLTPDSFILLEDGGKLLLEDGFALLKESE